jgi:hypothetical protein
MKGGNTMARPIEDEGMHPAGTEESWQESVVVAWRDVATGIGANLHMGCEINRGISNVMVGVYTDAGPRFRYNADDLPLRRVTDTVGLRSGPLMVVHDGEHLRALVDAEGCEVNLVVTDLTEDISTPVQRDEDFRQKIAKNHFNVECKVDGHVVLDGKHYEVQGCGHRDHSYGPRTFTAGDSVVAYRWMAGGVPDEMTFSLYSLVTAQGSFARRGWVRIGQKRQEVSHETVVLMMDDGISAYGAQAVCRLENGDSLTIDYTVRGDALMTVRELHNVMSVGDVVLGDGSKGYATLEYIECASQGIEPPVFSLGVAIANGLDEQPPSRMKLSGVR